MGVYSKREREMQTRAAGRLRETQMGDSTPVKTNSLSGRLFVADEFARQSRNDDLEWELLLKSIEVLKESASIDSQS
jgi:hypothetical protein